MKHMVEAGETFKLKKSTKIINHVKNNRAVEHACERFERDKCMTLNATEEEGGVIVLNQKTMQAEQYEIEVTDGQIQIQGNDERSFIYALNEISEKYLGILPFWFWNDQKIKKREDAEVPCGHYRSSQMRIRYRGWFINDEVLISHWDAGVAKDYPWEMVFEALLRCGGNLVIPGTDKNSKYYAPIASQMGLMVTHHHAEPLGAEMFLRAYPNLEPSYLKYADLFENLWKEAIERQKDEQVIWNIGFRGQGDVPFWENDPAYNTSEKRGALISSIMKKQYDMVRAEIPDAVFCTNLYGEILELYREGCLKIPEDVILIWADNGYGKMVSRRQGNHNPRIPALPEEGDKGRHGTYYHVSFYDLQAANHITMLPNSMEFVEQELKDAMQHGITDLWMINASNIKPHVYPLDFIANLWRQDAVSAKDHRTRYIAQYYGSDCDAQQLKQMQKCFERYPEVTVPFGKREDEHAGEQFFNYVVRDFIYGWMQDGGIRAVEELLWYADKHSFGEQMEWFGQTCKAGYPEFDDFYRECKSINGGELWKDSLLLQAGIHWQCLKGSLLFAKAFRVFKEGQYQDAFFLLGNAAEEYEKANALMREREHDKWQGFYANDCLTDVKETAYCLKRLMGYIRNLGDGPDYYLWQREVTYSENDSKVVLITNMENHMTDWELYLAGKNGRLDR